MTLAIFISPDLIDKNGLSTAITVGILTWFFIVFVPWIMRRYEDRLDKQEKRHIDAEAARQLLFEKTLSKVLDHAREMTERTNSRIGVLEGIMTRVGEDVRDLHKNIPKD